MQRGLSKLGLTEIRVAGFGGQGVILAAIVIGKAAAIFEGAYATMTQSFGPEARGGSSAAQVILSGEPILYPYVTQPDILVVMSQEAYKVFKPQLKPGGILIVEQELVRIDHPPQGVRFYGVPANRSYIIGHKEVPGCSTGNGHPFTRSCPRRSQAGSESGPDTG